MFVVFETEDCSGSLILSVPGFVSRHVTSLGDCFGIFFSFEISLSSRYFLSNN